MDNRWVVPHNNDLCVKNDYYVNVELLNLDICAKYLYKYMAKGLDMSTVIVKSDHFDGDSGPKVNVNHNDMIQQYMDCHFVYASESIWHIFGFITREHHPFVERLSFHLLSKQSVLYEDGDDL